MITKDSATRVPEFERVVDAASQAPFVDFIAADDSSDGTPDVLRSKGFKIISGGGTRGSARQAVIDATKTDWLMFVDDDVFLDKGWFDRMKPSMQKAGVGLVWGAYRIKGAQERSIIEGFRLRGGTHDTMIRMEAVKDIRIPWFLNWYEDAFIRNHVVRRGYATEVIPSLCEHVKTPKAQEKEVEARDYRLWQYQMCKVVVGLPYTDVRKAVRTLVAVPLKSVEERNRKNPGWFLKKRMEWFRFYSGAGITFPNSDPPEITRMIQRFKGRVAWDIGANIGAVSDYLSTRFREVYSFEPAKESYSFLEAVRRKNVHPFNFAISDLDSCIDLAVRERSFKKWELTSEIRERNLKTWGEKLGERTVQARTVDSLVKEGLPAPDLIKVDVEGHESRVIKGAMSTIRSFLPTLFIEIHAKQLGEEILSMIGGIYRVEVRRHPDYKAEDEISRNHFWIEATKLSGPAPTAKTRQPSVFAKT